MQGKTSAVVGLNNRIYGKYGFAAGKNNKVGYNDYAFGQDIDFSKVQAAFGAGARLYAGRSSNFSVMFGCDLRAGNAQKYIPVQFITGFFNKNKSRTVFEVGAGHSEALRKNAFSVDRDGYVFSDEKFLPLQCFTQQDTTFSETEREQKITNVSSQVTFRDPSGLGIREEKTFAAYGPYIYVHAQKAGLTVGKWYVMVVGITNYSDNWKVSVRGYVKVDSETEKEYGFASDEISVSKGKHYILCPIYVERLDSSYGFWCSPNIRDITVNSVELYEAKDIGISHKLTDHFPDNVIGDKTHVEMMNSAIGNNVIRKSIVSELPKCYTVCDANIKSVFTAPLSSNTTSAAYGLYTGNGYLDGLKAEITEKTSAIEFAAHKSETDSKIDLLSLKAEKSGETVRISDACELEQTADVSIASKNLIPYPYAETTKTVNGVTFTDNGDASVTVSGTPTGYADFVFATVSVKPGQTYTLLKNQTGANNVSFVISERTNQSAQKEHTSDSPQNTFTFTTSESTDNLIIRIKRTDDSTACTGTFKPQLELGSVATDYEPYKAPVTYTPDSDGKVSGVTLGSDTATLTSDTDGVIINAKYKKDITKAFAQLEEKINSLSSASTVANVETL